MASSESSSVPKKLSELKVVELRNELEKRGLEKTGCKAALVERLSRVLEEDGEDPDTYEFELSSDLYSSKATSRVVEDSGGEQGSGEEAEDEEKEEAIDPDALQLSIEDEEKLLNEEEESYEKGTDDAQAEEDAPAKDGSGASDEEKPAAAEVGTGDSAKGAGEAVQESPPKKAKSASATSGKDAAKLPGKVAKDGSKKVAASPSSGRNVWVSGLSSSTRAADLKALFSKHGKVVSAKIVTNARTPGARCYGFITMGTLDQVTKCIQHLHRTELHGKMISVERTKKEPGGALKQAEANQAKAAKAAKAKAAAEASSTPAAATETKTEEGAAKPTPAKKKTPLASAAAIPKKKPLVRAPGKPKASEAAKKVLKKEDVSDEDLVVIDEKTDRDETPKEKVREKRSARERSRSHSRERRPHGRSRERLPFLRRRFLRPFHDRGPVARGSRFFRRVTFFRRAAPTTFFRGRGGFRSSFGGQARPSLSDTLAFRKIREEHVRTREREEARRNFQESLRQKELERRQREEAFRLEREREHLRVEREKLEREKLELIRLEREKQRLERERIQREREDLRQRQLMAGRVEERPEPSRRMKRPLPPERREDDPYWAEKKRSHSRPDFPSSAAVPAKLPPPSSQSRSSDRLDHHFSSSHHHSSHHSSHHRHHVSPSNIPSASGSMFSSSSRPAEYRSGPPTGGPSATSRRSGPPVRSEWRQVSDGAPARREHRFSEPEGGKPYGGSASSSSSRGFSSWSKPSFSSSQSWEGRKESGWNGSGDDARWRPGASGSGNSGYASGGGVSNGSLGGHGSSGGFGERFSGGSSRRY